MDNYITTFRLTKEESQAFKFAGLFSTILVVAIHYNTRHFIIDEEILSANSYFQTFFNDGLARIAVPFFAASAGFFFFYRIKIYDANSYTRQLTNKLKTLLIPYFLGLFIIMIPEVSYQLLNGFNVQGLNFQWLVRNTLVAPIAIQFWFIRDLIVLTTLSLLLHKSSKKFPLTITFIACLLWIVDLELLPRLSENSRPLISIEVLFFYLVGAHFAINNPNCVRLIFAITKTHIVLMVLSLAILIALKSHLVLTSTTTGSLTNYVYLSQIAGKLSIIVGLPTLLRIAIYAKSCFITSIASFNFFVYLFHGLPINRVITKISDYIVADPLKFYSNFPIAVLVTYGSAFVIRQLAPKFYRILTGGR